MRKIDLYKPAGGGGRGASVETIGIDHIYVAVRDMERSEEFHDRVMVVLRFRKGTEPWAAIPISCAAKVLRAAGAEVMNFRELRRKLMYDWEVRAGL